MKIPGENRGNRHFFHADPRKVACPILVPQKLVVGYYVISWLHRLRGSGLLII